MEARVGLICWNDIKSYLPTALVFFLHTVTHDKYREKLLYAAFSWHKGRKRDRESNCIVNNLSLHLWICTYILCFRQIVKGNACKMIIKLFSNLLTFFFLHPQNCIQDKKEISTMIVPQKLLCSQSLKLNGIFPTVYYCYLHSNLLFVNS